MLRHEDAADIVPLVLESRICEFENLKKLVSNNTFDLRDIKETAYGSMILNALEIDKEKDSDGKQLITRWFREVSDLLDN